MTTDEDPPADESILRPTLRDNSFLRNHSKHLMFAGRQSTIKQEMMDFEAAAAAGEEDENYLQDSLQNSNSHHIEADDEHDEDDDQDQDEDEEDYLPLDTIVEEQEDLEDDAMSFVGSNSSNNRVNCDTQMSSKNNNHRLPSLANAKIQSDNATTTPNKHNRQVRRPQAENNSSHDIDENDDDYGDDYDELDDENDDPNTTSLTLRRQQQQQQQQKHQATSARKFTPETSAGDSRRSSSRKSSNIMQQKPKPKQSSSHHLLPSTNRLISEHQARNQQQALFRALTERQKLLDELGADEQRQDLMSGTFSLPQLRAQPNHLEQSSSNSSTVSSSGRRRSRTHSGSNNQSHLSHSNNGIKLSTVNLSAMSDVVLDNLHELIASTSSSSLSSNGDSLDSSDISSTHGDDEHDELDNNCDTSQTTQRNSLHHQSNTHSAQDSSTKTSGGSGRPRIIVTDAPNIVGIHEDVNQMARAQRRQLSCRTAHRKGSGACDSDDDDPDDDDDRNDHELVVNLNVNSGATSSSLAGDSSLSPSTLASGPNQQRSSDLIGAGFRSADFGTETTSGPTSGDTPAGSGSSPLSQLADSQESVETVLRRMLEALHEVGRLEGERGMRAKQEQLNELLERGFSHLEQLLNYPLDSAPPPKHLTTTTNQLGSQQQQQHRLPKLISPSSLTNNSHVTTLSKDSDYGSDTQSADCLSHSATDVQPASVASGAPLNSNSTSPTLSTSGSGVGGQTTAAGNGLLSPAAIELSNKLFESIKKLAQQQQQPPPQSAQVPVTNQQQQQQQLPAQKRAPMKSVVMINATRSPSAASMASGRESANLLIGVASQRATPSLSSSRNPTPDNQINQQQQQQVDEVLSKGANSASSTTVSTNASRTSTPTTHPRAQFKTCVNIGAVKVSQNVAGLSVANEEQPTVAISKTASAKATSMTTTTTVCQLEQQQVKHQQELHQLERRRSSRSSLRRRPSFTGSINGSQNPRAGSPVPRSLLAEVVNEPPEVAPTSIMTSAAAASQQQQQQATASERTNYKRLQRALIYGQKYNYSPTKLAYSKLGAQLHLSNDSGKDSAAYTYTDQTGQSRTIVATSKREVHQQQQQQQPSGLVELDISYFAKSGSLTVHLLQCAELAPVSKRRTTCNPSKTGKRKSSIKRGQLEPKFDERFTFGPIQLADFDGKCLWLSVWHKDRLGRRNEFLGELLLPLAQVRSQLLSSDLCQSTAPKWYQLTEHIVESSSQAGGAAYNGDTSAKTLPANRKMAPQPNDQTDTCNSNRSKLDEFQLRAARLTSCAVSPPSATAMNVKLGPLAELGPQSALITGQLFVALKFVTPTGRASRNSEGELHVLIKEAHNIAGFEAPTVPAMLAAASGECNTPEALLPPPPPSGSLPNPFCKCYLLSANGQRLSKLKTPILKRTSNPRWDHKCQFTSVRLNSLQGQAVEIQLFNRDSILVSSNEYLGGIRLCRSPQQQQQLGEEQQNSADDSSMGSARSSMQEGGVPKEPLNGASLLRQQTLERFESANGASLLCNERESRLWNQMLAKPNIWVYGELRLRQLQPLIAANLPGANSNTAELNAE